MNLVSYDSDSESGSDSASPAPAPVHIPKQLSKHSSRSSTPQLNVISNRLLSPRPKTDAADRNPPSELVVSAADIRPSDSSRIERFENERQKCDQSQLSALLQPVTATGMVLNLPTLPEGECDAQMQNKVEKWTNMRRINGRHFNDQLARTQSFANPAIMSKLIEFLGLSEHGSNLDKSLFDPEEFPVGMFHDEIAKAHKLASERPPFYVNSTKSGQMDITGGVQFTAASASLQSQERAILEKAKTLLNAPRAGAAGVKSDASTAGGGAKRRWDAA
ncbi:SAP30-binding protein [Chytriomyces hyalinus]|nr:SAP30-binding protein [Chytriomyces hyalinus]